MFDDESDRSPHLLWSLESLEKGNPVGLIQVNEDTTKDALLALNKMLAIK